MCVNGTLEVALFVHSFSGINALFKGSICYSLALKLTDPGGTCPPTPLHCLGEANRPTEDEPLFESDLFLPAPNEMVRLCTLIRFRGEVPLSQMHRFDQCQLQLSAQLLSLDMLADEHKTRVGSCKVHSRGLVNGCEFWELSFLEPRGGSLFGCLSSVVTEIRFSSNEVQVRQELERRQAERQKSHLRNTKEDDSDLVVVKTISEYFRRCTGMIPERMVELYESYTSLQEESLAALRKGVRRLDPHEESEHSRRVLELYFPSRDFTHRRKGIFSEILQIRICTLGEMFRNCLENERVRLCGEFLEQCAVFSKVLCEGWAILQSVLAENAPHRTFDMRKEYALEVVDHLGQNVISYEEREQDRVDSVQVFRQLRRKKLQALLSIRVVDRRFFPRDNCLPLIIDRITRYNIRPKKNYSPVVDVFVLTFGFMACRIDLTNIVNAIKESFPFAEFILPFANEGRTKDSLQLQGRRFAEELTARLQVFENSPFRLHFIGHSMGGVVLRAAMKHLFLLDGRFHSLVTFSSPHLGYLETSSALMALGVTILSSIQKNDSIRELAMKDDPNPKRTFMYRLSEERTFQKFKKVMLVVSTNDGYVPREAALLEMLPSSAKSSQSARLHAEMFNNATEGLQLEELHRMEVDFKLETSIDSVIGRASHVQFLKDSVFLRTWVRVFKNFFQ